MESEAQPGELHSRHIVAQMDDGLSERSRRFQATHGLEPKLTILCDNFDYEPSAKYLGIKTRVGAKLGIAVESVVVDTTLELPDYIDAANDDPATHGVIIQFPLRSPEHSDEMVGMLAPHKDVDGLGPSAWFAPATPNAAIRLLDGYGIDYVTERVTVLGAGRLVGAPLLRLMKDAGARNVRAFDIESDRLDIVQGLNEANIIVTAMGKPGLMHTDLFKDVKVPHVLVDAGAAEQDGLVRGDVSDELREVGLANGWLITPVIGGIGPLTVRTLLSNVVSAAEQQQA